MHDPDPAQGIPASEFKPPEVDPNRKFSFLHPSIPAAAIMCLAAAGLHGGVTGAHFEEWVGYGIFFLVSFILQLFWGGLALVRYWESREALGDPYPRAQLVHWEARFHRWGAWGNFCIAVLYVVTRTVGVPFLGPAAGETEAWDFYGISTTVLELVVWFLGLQMARDVATGKAPQSKNDLDALKA